MVQKSSFPALELGDTVYFFFVYREHTGLWEYVGNFTSHATWYRDGKFLGDFVKECMEECVHELQRNNSISPHNVYIIDDYLDLYEIHDAILPDLPHIPQGHNIKNYSKSNDWLIGFPKISFINDTIVVSSKAFRRKDYKNDFRIKKHIQCTLHYLYNIETQSSNICKKETIQIANN